MPRPFGRAVRRLTHWEKPSAVRQLRQQGKTPKEIAAFINMPLEEVRDLLRAMRKKRSKS